MTELEEQLNSPQGEESYKLYHQRLLSMLQEAESQLKTGLDRENYQRYQALHLAIRAALTVLEDYRSASHS